MLGKRNSQRSLFQVPFWAQELIADDSFYARMGVFWRQVSHDEDLAGMYEENQGRPSIPPSILSGVLILQYFDNATDREAADKVRFDLRWKLALDLPLDNQGFDYSNLSRFRSRLAEHGQERYAFDALLRLAIAAGFLRRDAEQVIDSTPIYGAAALQDTYTLLRNGLRKLLVAMGEKDPARRQLAKRLKLEQYLGGEKPELDWADPEARRAHLQELVAGAGRLLAEARSADLEAGSEAQGAQVLLEQLLAQDVTQDDAGHPIIRRGVATDRVISTVDTEMRHGRKSASTRFDGYKGHVAVEPETELVTDVLVTPGNAYDGEAVEPLVDEQAARYYLRPQAVVGDQSVIDAERRHALCQRGIEPVGKVSSQRLGGRYAKADFQIDLAKGAVTCPAGHTVREHRERTDQHGRLRQIFTFPRELCQACPRRMQCTTAQRTGRTIQIHPYESLLQAAREEQQTDAFKQRYHAARSTVERVIAHLVRHGFRQGRYFGLAKTLFQALWAAAAVNLQRLMTLLSEREGPQALRMVA